MAALDMTAYEFLFVFILTMVIFCIVSEIKRDIG